MLPRWARSVLATPHKGPIVLHQSSPEISPLHEAQVCGAAKEQPPLERANTAIEPHTLQPRSPPGPANAGPLPACPPRDPSPALSASTDSPTPRAARDSLFSTGSVQPQPRTAAIAARSQGTASAALAEQDEYADEARQGMRPLPASKPRTRHTVVSRSLASAVVGLRTVCGTHQVSYFCVFTAWETFCGEA